jgi:hypothetical protein
VIVAAVVLAALVVASLVPWPGRRWAATVALCAAILAPLVAFGVWLASRPRTEPGTWLLLMPLTFAWLAVLDLRFGVGARIARPPRSRRGE